MCLLLCLMAMAFASRAGARRSRVAVALLLASCSSGPIPTPPSASVDAGSEGNGDAGSEGNGDAARREGDAARAADGTLAADAAKKVEILATSPVSSWPTTVAVGATHVYWSSPTGIMGVPKAGGAPEKVAATSGEASAVAVDATSVFYAVGLAIHKAPLTGGDSVELASSTVTNAIALDATFVYWADNRGPIKRVPREGGDTEQISLSAGYPSRLAMDANALYWVDATGILTTTPGIVMPTMLWMGAPSINALIAVQGSEVFVTAATMGGHDVSTLAVTGGEPLPLAMPELPSGLAVDAANVYFSDNVRGTVEYVPRSGGAPVPLATEQAGPDAIALDEDFVYWVNTSGSVARVRKP
jgi:hypothetical protein